MRPPGSPPTTSRQEPARHHRMAPHREVDRPFVSGHAAEPLTLQAEPLKPRPGRIAVRSRAARNPVSTAVLVVCDGDHASTVEAGAQAAVERAGTAIGERRARGLKASRAAHPAAHLARHGDRAEAAPRARAACGPAAGAIKLQGGLHIPPAHDAPSGQTSAAAAIVYVGREVGARAGPRAASAVVPIA